MTFPALSVNPDVVWSELDEGGVLFDLGTKQYFALNAAGLLVWKLVDAGLPLDEIAARLAGQYGPAPDGRRASLDRFASELVSHGLAAGTGDVVRADPDATRWPATWEAPTVTPHGRPLAEVILSPFDPTEPVPE